MPVEQALLILDPSNTVSWFSQLGNRALEVLFPSHCPSCSTILEWGNEGQHCLACLTDFTPLMDQYHTENPVTQHLVGRIPIRHGYAHLAFLPEGHVQKTIHQIKYAGHRRVAHYWGQQMGMSMLKLPWLDDIDGIIPVPIHWRRKFKRGYNQSLVISQGIHDITGKPIWPQVLKRYRYTITQTGKNRWNRMKNLQACISFEKRPRDMRHVLIVDDVLTTGATLEVVAQTLLEACPDLRISVSVLAVGGL